MLKFIKPMLACSLLKPTDKHDDATILAAMQKLRYPVLATLKKDGIRAIKLDELRSRTLKLIPNISIRERAKKLPYGFDMELWNSELAYDEVESIVMSRVHERSDEIQFHSIDMFSEEPYHVRIFKTPIGTDVYWCSDADTLFKVFIHIEQEQGEGICFRTPDSPYKQGRSTLKEQYLIKLTRSIRSECTIVGVYEQMENANASNRNAVGAMDRSSCKANLYGKNTLGGFHCVDSNGLTFDVGSGVGWTDRWRKEVWNNPALWIGKQITIKSKGHGQKIKPRSPIMVGVRVEGY